MDPKVLVLSNDLEGYSMQKMESKKKHSSLLKNTFLGILLTSLTQFCTDSFKTLAKYSQKIPRGSQFDGILICKLLQFFH